MYRLLWILRLTVWSKLLNMQITLFHKARLSNKIACRRLLDWLLHNVVKLLLLMLACKVLSALQELLLLRILILTLPEGVCLIVSNQLM